MQVSNHQSIYKCLRASLVAQKVKSLLAIQETQVRSLVWEDPLEKDMATHSSILAWRIPWIEKSDRLQSMGSQRVRNNWVTNTHTHTHTHTHTYLLLISRRTIFTQVAVWLFLESDLFLLNGYYSESHEKRWKDTAWGLLIRLPDIKSKKLTSIFQMLVWISDQRSM